MEQPLLEQEPKASESRWYIRAREVIHKNPWYEYRHDSGTTDQGKPFEYYYVYKPMSTAVVAITKDNEVIFVRQYRYVVGHDALQLPGGSASQDLSAQDTILQELREETGYVPESIKQIGVLDYAPGYSTDKVSLFLAQGCQRKQEQVLEDTEAGMQVELYALPQAYDMAASGEITDPLSLCALFLARNHLPGLR